MKEARARYAAAEDHGKHTRSCYPQIGIGPRARFLYYDFEYLRSLTNATPKARERAVYASEGTLQPLLMISRHVTVIAPERSLESLLKSWCCIGSPDETQSSVVQ